jgi:hypothetical protein
LNSKVAQITEIGAAIDIMFDPWRHDYVESRVTSGLCVICTNERAVHRAGHVGSEQGRDEESSSGEETVSQRSTTHDAFYDNLIQRAI